MHSGPAGSHTLHCPQLWQRRRPMGAWSSSTEAQPPPLCWGPAGSTHPTPGPSSRPPQLRAHEGPLGSGPGPPEPCSPGPGVLLSAHLVGPGVTSCVACSSEGPSFPGIWCTGPCGEPPSACREGSGNSGSHTLGHVKATTKVVPLCPLKPQCPLSGRRQELGRDPEGPLPHRGGCMKEALESRWAVGGTKGLLAPRAA